MKEPGSIQMPNDIDAIKILLENTEIDYDENENDNHSSYIELNNGIVFSFNSDGKLLDIEMSM